MDMRVLYNFAILIECLFPRIGLAPFYSLTCPAILLGFPYIETNMVDGGLNYMYYLDCHLYICMLQTRRIITVRFMTFR